MHYGRDDTYNKLRARPEVFRYCDERGETTPASTRRRRDRLPESATRRARARMMRI